MELGALVIVNFVAACLCAISLSVKRHPIFATITWLLTCVYGYGVYLKLWGCLLACLQICEKKVFSITVPRKGAIVREKQQAQPYLS